MKTFQELEFAFHDAGMEVFLWSCKASNAVRIPLYNFFLKLARACEPRHEWMFDY